MDDGIEKMMTALMRYQDDSVNRLSYQQMALSQASLAHKTTLLKAGFGEYLANLLNCVEANQNVLDEIRAAAGPQFGFDPNTERPADQRTLRGDHARVNDLLLSLAREWSDQGRPEREAVFGPVLEELEERVGSILREDVREVEGIKVLVPGSRLARLPYEIALRLPGVEVLANESNCSLLFGANFVLNHCERVSNYRVYPFVSDLTDRLSTTAVTTPVAFPDVCPKDRPDGARLVPVPADFPDVVGQHQGTVDVVVTAFFLDTVRNPVETVDQIGRVLKPGSGVWINVGNAGSGCYYTDEDNDDEAPAISLPWNVMKAVMEESFEVLRDDVLEIESCFSPGQSMRQNVLQCPFTVCRKK